jgi:hypothetical protein
MRKKNKINPEMMLCICVLTLILISAADVFAVTYIGKSTGNQVLWDVIGLYNNSGTTGFFSNCPTGNSIRAISPNGAVTCEADDSGGSMGSWYIAASGTGGSEQVTDGETITFSAGTGTDVTRSTSTITIGNTGVISESDPQVGYYGNVNYGCYGTGSQVNCGDGYLWWDPSSHRMGLGNQVPSYPLDVQGTVTATSFSCGNCFGTGQIDGTQVQERTTGGCGSAGITQINQGGTVNCGSCIGTESDPEVYDTPTGDGMCMGFGSYVYCTSAYNFYWVSAADEMRIGSFTDQGTYALQVAGGIKTDGFNCNGCIGSTDTYLNYCSYICNEEEVGTVNNQYVCYADGSGIIQCDNSAIQFDGSALKLTGDFLFTGTDSDLKASSGNLYINYDEGGMVQMKDNLSIGNVPSSYSYDICSENSNSGRMGMCSSNRRLKENIDDIDIGLETVLQLRPVVFTWNENNMTDLGFIAEEVVDIDPILAKFDEEGVVKSVKYSQMSALLSKAIQEQQAEISMLKGIVCKDYPNSNYCKKKTAAKAKVFPKEKLKYIPPSKPESEDDFRKLIADKAKFDAEYGIK